MKKTLTTSDNFNLALRNHQKKNYQVAINLYKRVLKLEPKHLDAHHNLGVVFQEIREYQEAKNYYEKVIEIDPNHAIAQINLGGILNRLGEHSKAISCYEKAIEIDPNHVIAHNNLGTIFNALGNNPKAISCYEKAIEIDPNHAIAHNNLGTMFNVLGNNPKAISCYEKAIEINPNYTDALYNLGVLFFSIKKYKNAAEQFKLINYKNSKSYLLNCLYNMDDKSTFFKVLDDLINQGESNPIIGSLTSRSEIKYGIKKPNLFCKEPLKYTLMTNLTEEYDFENFFVKPIKDILKENTFSFRRQDLLKNSNQTAGNIFDKKNNFLDKIKDIIHLEVKKYQEHFKESTEGVIKNWPNSYSIYAWLVSMKSGGKINPHMHDVGWLSGSFYINVPPKLKTDSGNLVVCIDDNEQESGNNLNPKKIMNVVTGSLCLFPSSLYHYTIPFESKEDRIVLAFDVRPD